jgi:tryptophan synthase alpha chain
VEAVAGAIEANEPAAPRVLAKVKALGDAVRGARVKETV